MSWMGKESIRGRGGKALYREVTKRTEECQFTVVQRKVVAK
jgi:hypothetical protein